MKKLLSILLLFIILLPINVLAEEIEKDNVTLSNCVDSESARFILGVNEIKVKFIGIQLEEKIISNENDEINGSYISDYVCSALKNAKQIRIEYEPNIERKDKYGRVQAWVFVDDILLQEDLIKNGYARSMYIEENYLYFDKLKEAQNYAKENKLGIWVEEKQKEEPSTKKEESKKRKGIIGTIIDFFASIINKIIEIVDNLINSIL